MPTTAPKTKKFTMPMQPNRANPQSVAKRSRAGAPGQKNFATAADALIARNPGLDPAAINSIFRDKAEKKKDS